MVLFKEISKCYYNLCNYWPIAKKVTACMTIILWRLVRHPGLVLVGRVSGLQKLSRGFLWLVALLPKLLPPGSLYCGVPLSPVVYNSTMWLYVGLGEFP